MPLKRALSVLYVPLLIAGCATDPAPAPQQAPVPEPVAPPPAVVAPAPIAPPPAASRIAPDPSTREGRMAEAYKNFEASRGGAAPAASAPRR